MQCFCKKSKPYNIRIVLLDEQELVKEIHDNTKGQEILDSVFLHLNLLETAYFGLRYMDASNQTHWLDATKGVVKQLKGSNNFSLYFGVKFYAADPCKLLEEITRYQFFLQVKQDILQGRLPVSFETAAELGAYAVQSEIGDFDSRRHSKGYVSEFRFTSNQTAELEARIEDRHKELVGLQPAAAEYSFLEKVKWLEMYGVDLHPVLGEDNVEYFLGLTPNGIIVLRYKNKVGHYFWPRISKIYFKGRYFMIKICDRNNEETTYGFETPSKPACKHLWKCCVEHHAFFRLLQVSPHTTDIFSLGSRFRYSGRTEKQAQADVQMQLRSPPHFTRTASRRYQRRSTENLGDGNNSSSFFQKENGSHNQVKIISVPQPINLMYRSTSSIPVATMGREATGSPRSTRSAPWSTAAHNRGLYSTNSKVLSGHRECSSAQSLHKVNQRSSSVDSQSSNDSKYCRRHKRHRSRRSSDNESELSKSSSRSHHRQRHENHGHYDSDSFKNHKHRRKTRSSNRGSRFSLVNSEAQWLEVQKRQAEGGSGVQQATVINNISRISGYLNSGMETESEKSYRYKRKQHKKHRSRSRSPSEFVKGRLPEEVKKHLEFNLVETEGMSESQLKHIPYKVVDTNSDGKIHRKHSPNGRRKHHSKSVKKSPKPKKLSNGENSLPQFSSQQNLTDAVSLSAKRKPLVQISPKDLNYLNDSDKI